MDIKEIELLRIETEKDNDKKEDYEDKVLEFIEGRELNDEEIGLIIRSVVIDQGYIVSEYINNTDKEKRDTVFKKIVSNEVYKNNDNGAGVKLSLSILAYASINNWGNEVWKRFMLNVVHLSSIKENESLKFIDGIEEWVKTFFIDILWKDVNNLPSLVKINEAYIKSNNKNKEVVPLFVCLLKQTLNAYKEDKEIFDKKAKLIEWTKSFRPQKTDLDENDSKRDNETKVQSEAVNKITSEKNSILENKINTEISSKKKDSNPNASADTSKEQKPKESKEKRPTTISLKDKSEQYKKIIDIAICFEKIEEENKKLKTKSKDLEEKCKMTNEEKKELQQDLDKWIQQCGEKQKDINQLKNEIEHRNEVIDIVKADKSESDQEYKNALGAALKSSFIDFCELREMPMSNDVGDAISDTLNNVFKILERQGINISK